MEERGLIEREISSPVTLCNDRGELLPDSIGWARHPLINCNLQGRWLRKKRWNYWLISGPQCVFSAAIINTDYIGRAFFYFLDINTMDYLEQGITVPLGRGCKMPNGVTDSLGFCRQSLQIFLNNEGQDTRLIVKGKGIETDILVRRPAGHETLNVVIPWNKRQFQLTSKQNCLPVEGYIMVRKKQYVLEPAGTFASLDFGRGIWPHKIAWNWATASGLSAGGQVVGLNLGSRWTDGTGVTENALVVDGQVHKLSEKVFFNLDRSDMMRPWQIHSAESDRVCLDFEPVYKRAEKSSMLVLSSDLQQLMGYFSGRVVTEDGQVIILNRLLGSVEEHHSKW